MRHKNNRNSIYAKKTKEMTGGKKLNQVKKSHICAEMGRGEK